VLEAIDLTSRTFEDRARLYRNLVVAVSLVSIASLLSALLCWRAWPLAGLILLVPLSGGFVFLDGRLVERWRSGIVGMNESRGLDVSLFRSTISQFKHLPANTLQAMLATLAACGATGAKSASAAGSKDPASRQPGEWRILARTATLTIALTGLAAALHWRFPWPLLLAVGFAALFVFVKGK